MAGGELFRLFGTIFIKDEDARKSMNEIDKGGKQLKSGFDELEKASDRFGTKLLDKLTKVGLALGAAATAAGGFLAKIGVEFNASMETSNTAWATVLGNVDKAKQMVSDLQKMGANTPFEFKGLDTTAKMLVNLGGIGQDQVIPTMTKIGDAVAALGGDDTMLENVTKQITQMMAKGKVSAQDMNTIAEDGLPVWDLMAKATGKSKEELIQLSAQGKLMAKDVVPKLIDQMGTQYKGAMDAQSKTFSGLMSTLKDNFNMFLGQVTQPLFEQIKAIMPQILAELQKLSDWVTGHMPQIQAATQAAVNVVIKVFGDLVSILKFAHDHATALEAVAGTLLAAILAFKAISIIIEIMKAWEAVMKIVAAAQIALNLAMEANPIGIVIVAIGALIAIGYELIKHWDDVKQACSELWDWIKDHWEQILIAVTGPIGMIIVAGTELVKHWDDVKAALDGVGQWFADIWGGIVGVVRDGANHVIDLINSVIDALDKVNVKLPKFLGGGSVGFNINEISHFATGVQNFSGGLAVVGEEGPELVRLPQGSDVIPNRQTEQMLSAGGPQQSVIVPVYLDGREIARAQSKPQYDAARARTRAAGLVMPT